MITADTSTIRCAELSDDAIAVIISTGNTIDFCFLSDAMKSLPQLTWLRKGSPVPNKTGTAGINADPASVMSGARAVANMDVLDWLGGTRSAIVAEAAVGLGRYGKTLTILSSESIGRENEDQEDEETDENVTERTKAAR